MPRLSKPLATSLPASPHSYARLRDYSQKLTSQQPRTVGKMGRKDKQPRFLCSCTLPLPEQIPRCSCSHVGISVGTSPQLNNG